MGKGKERRRDGRLLPNSPLSVSIPSRSSSFSSSSSSRDPNASSLASLPPELLYLIMRFLPLSSLISLSLTCRYIYLSSTHESIWRHMHRRKYNPFAISSHHWATPIHSPSSSSSSPLPPSSSSSSFSRKPCAATAYYTPPTSPRISVFDDPSKQAGWRWRDKLRASLEIEKRLRSSHFVAIHWQLQEFSAVSLTMEQLFGCTGMYMQQAEVLGEGHTLILGGTIKRDLTD